MISVKEFLTESKMNRSQAIKAAQEFVKDADRGIMDYGDEFDYMESLIRDMSVCSDKDIRILACSAIEGAEQLNDFIETGELFEGTLREIAKL